jgi:uracil-xanthine permease
LVLPFFFINKTALLESSNPINIICIPPAALLKGKFKCRKTINGTDETMKSTDTPHKKYKYLVYGPDDVPPHRELWILGFQQYLTMFGATFSIPLIVGGAMGMPSTEVGKLICCIFFASGIATLLQTTVGSRLPIIQGGSFAFLPPMLAVIGACSAKGFGYTMVAQEICGAILVASAFEIVLGFSGLIGKIRKLIGPVTIGPTIALIGLTLFGIGWPEAAKFWPIAVLTLVCLIVYGQILNRKYRIFMLFPILIAIATPWVVCAILTFTGVFGPGHAAYCDLTPIKEAPWFNIPFAWYNWGGLRFTPSFIIGFLAAFIASMIEEIGDYYAVCKMSELPPPEEWRINRGLGMAGVGCALAGIIGSCSGTTSYSENIGAIGLTRCGSRRVMQAGAIIMVVLGFVGKFGAIFATMPAPIKGALYCGLFGMIASVGLSNLMLCDMNSPRNLFIVGLSFFMGLSVPAWTATQPYGFGWTTATWAGEIIWILLNTGMAVAALLGIILDNTIPADGGLEERGLTKFIPELATAKKK